MVVIMMYQSFQEEECDHGKNRNSAGHSQCLYLITVYKSGSNPIISAYNHLGDARSLSRGVVLAETVCKVLCYRG